MLWIFTLLITLAAQAAPTSDELKALNAEAFTLQKELAGLSRQEYDLRQNLSKDLKSAEKTLAAATRLARVPKGAITALDAVGTNAKRAKVLQFMTKKLRNDLRQNQLQLATLIETSGEKQARLSELANIFQKRESYLKKAPDLAALIEQASLPQPTALSAQKRTGNAAKFLPQGSKIITEFKQKQKSGVASDGITLLTPPGAPVRALKDGQVIYSGEFRDFGELIILDHGDNLFTLYGGVSSPYHAQVGDQLKAGDRVGNAPASLEPQIYLEARKNKKNINPLKL